MEEEFDSLIIELMQEYESNENVFSNFIHFLPSTDPIVTKFLENSNITIGTVLVKRSFEVKPQETLNLMRRVLSYDNHASAAQEKQTTDPVSEEQCASFATEFHLGGELLSLSNKVGPHEYDTVNANDLKIKISRKIVQGFNSRFGTRKCKSYSPILAKVKHELKERNFSAAFYSNLVRSIRDSRSGKKRSSEGKFKASKRKKQARHHVHAETNFIVPEKYTAFSDELKKKYNDETYEDVSSYIYKTARQRQNLLGAPTKCPLSTYLSLFPTILQKEYFLVEFSSLVTERYKIREFSFEGLKKDWRKLLPVLLLSFYDMYPSAMDNFQSHLDQLLISKKVPRFDVQGNSISEKLVELLRSPDPDTDIVQFGSALYYPFLIGHSLPDRLFGAMTGRTVGVKPKGDNQKCNALSSFYTVVVERRDLFETVCPIEAVLCSAMCFVVFWKPETTCRLLYDVVIEFLLRKCKVKKPNAPYIKLREKLIEKVKGNPILGASFPVPLQNLSNSIN